MARSPGLYPLPASAAAAIEADQARLDSRADEYLRRYVAEDIRASMLRALTDGRETL